MISLDIDVGVDGRVQVPCVKVYSWETTVLAHQVPKARLVARKKLQIEFGLKSRTKQQGCVVPCSTTVERREHHCKEIMILRRCEIVAQIQIAQQTQGRYRNKWCLIDISELKYSE